MKLKVDKIENQMRDTVCHADMNKLEEKIKLKADSESLIEVMDTLNDEI